MVEWGKAALETILSRQGDNVAFLEAFTQAEDELLDWTEDIGEVTFFFQNQKEIFDSVWRQQQRMEQERHYFAEEAEALATANTIRTILKDAKPYRRMIELPTLQQMVDRAYARINEARKARVQDVIIQARGDIHTLAGDDNSLKNEVRKADEELEHRKMEALDASSPTLLDASITQILTYKDGVCRRMEQLIASRSQADAPKLRLTTLRRYDLLPQKRLSSPEEVDAYVDALRTRLLETLKDNDAIQLN